MPTSRKMVKNYILLKGSGDDIVQLSYFTSDKIEAPEKTVPWLQSHSHGWQSSGKN